MKLNQITDVLISRGMKQGLAAEAFDFSKEMLAIAATRAAKVEAFARLGMLGCQRPQRGLKRLRSGAGVCLGGGAR